MSDHDHEDSKVRYIVVDARDVYRTAGEAKERAKEMEGFDDGYVFCVGVNVDKYVALGGSAMTDQTREEVGEKLGINVVANNSSKRDTSELQPFDRFSPTLEVPTVYRFSDVIALEGEEANGSLTLLGDIPVGLGSCTLDIQGIKNSFDVIQAQTETLYMRCAFSAASFRAFEDAYLSFEGSRREIAVSIVLDGGNGEAWAEGKFELEGHEASHRDPNLIFVFLELKRDVS